GHPDDLRDVEHDFYQASLAAEAARRRRARRRRLQLVSGLLILAITASLYAWQQHGQAVKLRHAAQVTLARQLASQSSSTFDNKPDIAALLAVEAYRPGPGAEEREALTTASPLRLKHIPDRAGTITLAKFNPDGSTLATASDDNTAGLWNARTGQLIAPLTGHTGPVGPVAFSLDGTILATTSDAPTARLRNA